MFALLICLFSASWMRSQETVIGGLLPETTYSVTVAAYTTKGDGARSKPKVITTTGAGERGEQRLQPRRGGGGRASQEVPREYGQGTCAGGTERAGDATEVHALVICGPSYRLCHWITRAKCSKQTDTARAHKRTLKLVGLSSSA